MLSVWGTSQWLGSQIISVPGCKNLATKGREQGPGPTHLSAEPAISKLPKESGAWTLCWGSTPLTHLNSPQSRNDRHGWKPLPPCILVVQRSLSRGHLLRGPQARVPQASSSSQSRGQFPFEISVHLISLDDHVKDMTCPVRQTSQVSGTLSLPSTCRVPLCVVQAPAGLSDSSSWSMIVSLLPGGLSSHPRPALLFLPLLLGTCRDLGGRCPEFRRLQEKKVGSAYRRPESRPK